MSEKYTKENQTNIDYLKKSNLLLNLNHSQNEIINPHFPTIPFEIGSYRVS